MCRLPCIPHTEAGQPWYLNLGCLENACGQCLATCTELVQILKSRCKSALVLCKADCSWKKALTELSQGTSSAQMKQCGWPSARTAGETRVSVGITYFPGCMMLHVGLYCALQVGRWHVKARDLPHHSAPTPCSAANQAAFELHPGGRTSSPLACPWLFPHSL